MSSVLSSWSAAVLSPETEPREFISGEIPIAAIDPLRSDALGVKARREKVAHEPSSAAGGVDTPCPDD